MAQASEFLDYVVDQLGPVGGVAARRMFGGHTSARVEAPGRRETPPAIGEEPIDEALAFEGNGKVVALDAFRKK